MTFSPAALKSVLPVDESVRRLWVALSGGLDSTVLLHALAALELPLPIMALHINHQISPNALGWQEQCADLCRRLQIPFYGESVQVERAGRGLEDAAREARYGVFSRFVQAGDLLLTAHHADDQTETILLRLMRGSGPRGLAAMARQRVLGEGRLCRPLLDFSRAELEAYAQVEGLYWVEDESNANIRYDRNFLRQQITPLLRERWPNFNRQWQRTAELCASNDNLLDEIAGEDLARAEPRMERGGWSLSLELLRNLTLARRQNLLRYWLRLRGFSVPEQSHFQQIEFQLIDGRADAEAEVCWGNLALHRYRGRLHLVPLAVMRALPQHGPYMNVPLSSGESYEVLLSPMLRLHLEYCPVPVVPGFLRADIPDLQLRWRTGGERCQPQGRKHSQTLKKLLQEYGLEPWWRNHIPLIYSGDTMVAVGDLWVCAGFAAESGQAGYRVGLHCAVNQSLS